MAFLRKNFPHYPVRAQISSKGLFTRAFCLFAISYNRGNNSSKRIYQLTENRMLKHSTEVGSFYSVKSLKKNKINEKEAGDGPFYKEKKWKLLHLDARQGILR